MKPIRLVALDVDGTLTDRADRLRPAVREAVHDAVAAGRTVILVTGRGPVASRMTLDQIGLELPVIMANGALVHDQLDAPAVDRRLLPPDVAQAVVLAHRAAGYEALIYDDPAATNRVVCQRGANNLPFVVRNPHRVLWVPDVLEWLDHDVLLTTMLGPDEPTVRALAGQVVAALGQRVAVHPLWHPKYQTWSLDVGAPACDKGVALARYAQRLGIPLAQTLAIGDGLTDVPLLVAAGRAVAMGNACPEVVAVADEVVADNDHDGVAEALLRHVLTAEVA